jgi:hypothetical protein
VKEIYINAARSLKGPFKPRIMTSVEIFEHWRASNPEMDINKFYRVLNNLVDIGHLSKINRGLYVNNQTIPPVSANELPEKLYKKAIVTSHSALTHAGALNNPTNIITAAIPTDRASWAKSHRSDITNKMGRFWIFRMPTHVCMPPGLDDADLYTHGVPYLMASAEKALMDWIYIGSSSRFMTPDDGQTLAGLPPLDIDMKKIDQNVLSRIAKKMDLQGELKEWLEAKKQHDVAVNVMANMSQELGF